MAITFEAYARSSGAFKTPRPMPQGSPVGIIIHSTGADNPNLKRYVNAPEICGVNPYKNYFDRPDSNVCPHAVIGKDKNGEVKAAKLLPWNVCCWGCGSGSKGSYNYAPAYIQIEIAEAALMKNYPTIKPENIISHKEACARGYASNHGDPEHWLARFGKNMDWFRGQVAPEKQVRITAEISVAQSKVERYRQALQALGCSVKIE